MCKNTLSAKSIGRKNLRQVRGIFSPLNSHQKTEEIRKNENQSFEGSWALVSN
jgi:hypothetical protein